MSKKKIAPKKLPKALIRFTSEQAKQLYIIKKLTGEKMHTSAILKAIKEYPILHKACLEMGIHISHLEGQLSNFFTKIEAFNKASENLKNTKK